MGDDKRVTLSLELCKEIHEWMRTLSDLNAQRVAADLKFEMDRHREATEPSEEAIRESERKRISGMMFYHSLDVAQIEPALTVQYLNAVEKCQSMWRRTLIERTYRLFPSESLEKLSDAVDTNDVTKAQDSMRAIWLFENGKATS